MTTLSTVVQTNFANVDQAIVATSNNTLMTPYLTGQAIAALGQSSAWITKNAAYTIKNNEQIVANTASGSFTLTLPVTPNTGAKVTIADGSNTWSSNNLTIARNGSNIMSSNTDMMADVSGQVIELLYTDPVRGWILQNQSLAVPGTYIPLTYQRFLTVGTFTYVPSSPDVKRIRVFMRGGGGGAAGSVGASPSVYPGNGITGGNTVFSTFMTAGGAGPAGASYSFGTGGPGGIPVVTGISTFRSRTGGSGTGVSPASSGMQGGGAGGVGGFIGQAGGAASNNSGGGGGGAAAQNNGSFSAGYSGSSGGEGAEIDAWIMAPLAASYSVTVGAGGAGGAGGTDGVAGGAGGSGGIWIEEYYDAVSAPIAQGSLRYDIFQNITSEQQAISRATIGLTKKNYFLNGAMMVSQQNGNTAGSVNSYYPVDQFTYEFSNDGAVSIQQVASVTPAGSPNRLRVTVSTADAAIAASQYALITQNFEGLRVADLKSGTSTAKFVTFQFGCKGPAGTYSLSLRNSAVNRTYVAEFVITSGEANTDVVKYVTFQLDTSGIWNVDNTLGFRVCICLAAGTTFQQTPNVWMAGNCLGSTNQFNFMGTIGNTFELFDVGLYEGSTAPTFTVPDYVAELAACLRYYEKLDTTIYSAYTQASIGAGQYITWIFKVKKRTTPTMTGGIGNLGFGGTSLDGAFVGNSADGYAYWSSGSTANARM